MKYNAIYAAGLVGQVDSGNSEWDYSGGSVWSIYERPFCPQVSTAIGLRLFGIYIWIFTGIFRIASSKQAIVIGVMWLLELWKNDEVHCNLCCRTLMDQTVSRLQHFERQGLVIGIDLDGCCIISDLQNQVVTRHYVRQ